jgi:TolB-like protein/class 3 adenylate cyclase
MAEALVERRLAAILAADVAGYSRLMGADEVGTLAALKAHRREIVDSTIAAHKGRIVKTTGDGMLVEFASAVDAVTCAVAVQEKMANRSPEGAEPRILFRIGINVGDIIIDGDDIFGDGVNVAARVENECEPGGVCLSDDAYRQVRGKAALAFNDLGERSLKNIDRPVRIYAVRPAAHSGAAAVQSPVEADKPLQLPDKPSIAVLPFQNMSGDPEQEYFADGMVEEIITALSRTRWLFVIARASSFTYKNRAIDVKQVGRELGVRYVLEGSVRKAGNRVRIAGQLIDTSTRAHLWADRFDGELADIFDLQDQITGNVVGAIAPKLERAEIERAMRKRTENPDAYDYFLRGMAVFYQWTREANNEALSLFYKAIELDGNFSAAYGLAARCYARRKSAGWVTDRAYDIAETTRLGRLAAELGRDDAVALFGAGIALAFVVGNLDDGDALIDRAVALNPNLAAAWIFSGWVKAWVGKPEMAIEREARAMRLSPHDPQIYNMQAATAAAHFFAGRFEEALSWAEISIREQPDYIPSEAVAAASAALAGHPAAAAKSMARLRHLMPELRLSNLTDFFPIRRREDFERWADGLRRAGLPE